jgi:hypothetical protein
VVAGSIVNSDTLTGTLTHAGVNVGKYEITQQVALSNPNYTVTYQPDSITITPATLTVTPDSGQTKVSGSSDPTLTYAASGWKNGDSQTLLSGALSRVAGETVGSYNITAGTLSAGRNYTINFTAGVQFTITSALLHPDSIRINGTPIYIANIADNDTIFYTLPCGDDGHTIEIMYWDTLSLKQTLRKVNPSAFPFDTTITVRTKGDTLKRYKRYTVRVNRRYGLFDFVTEHLERIRIVVNNPAVNGGFEFDSCKWWYKKADEGNVWKPAILPPTQLYYTAGPSLAVKFTPEDSMYVVLYTTTAGDSIKTCPDATPSRGIANNANGKDDAEVGNYPYPNPVRRGGKIYLKQSIITSGDGTSEDKDRERYSTYRLFNSMGRLVASGSASVLIGGLTISEVGGIYLLVLDGKAGRRIFRIAVG